MRQYDNGYNMSIKLTEQLKIKIRDEFVYGYNNDNGVLIYPTIDNLVEKHSVARATLYRASQKESWQAQKNEVQTAIQQMLEEERLTKLVEENKKLDTNSLAVAQSMLVRVGRRLQQDLANQDGSNPLTHRELYSLSQTASNAQKIGKLALGQAQEISKVAANVSTPDALREILEQLDEVDAHISSRANHTYQ